MARTPPRPPAPRAGRSLPAWALPPILGVLVLLLLGGGVSALLADDVSVVDNSIASSAILQGDIDLQIAVQDDNGCDVATYQDGPIPGFTGLVDSNEYLVSGESYLDGPVLCIRNTGTSPARASVRTEVSVDQEDGACRPSEIEAGDTTCGPGDDGELAEEILMGYEWNCPSGGGSTPSRRLIDPAPVELGEIAPGEICRLGYYPEVVTSDVRLWQTDRLLYDLYVDGIVVDEP